MTPPLPAVSRPSKTTSTFRFFRRIHSHLEQWAGRQRCDNSNGRKRSDGAGAQQPEERGRRSTTAAAPARKSRASAIVDAQLHEFNLEKAEGLFVDEIPLRVARWRVRGARTVEMRFQQACSSVIGRSGGAAGSARPCCPRRIVDKAPTCARRAAFSSS